MSNTVTFRVKRSDSAQNRSTFQEYTFPYRKGMTVLEGLWYIVDRLDGSLGFRYSCRGAVCGSCAMRINGDIRLACEMQISTFLPDNLTLEPLPYMTVIRDLIVDMEPFFAKYQEIQPYLVQMKEHDRENLQSVEERKTIQDAVKCILCASCYSVCPLVPNLEGYLGPAALSAAQRFAFDSRNEKRIDMLTRVNSLNGADGCRKISRCTAVCPKQVAPSDRIQELKDEIKTRSGKGERLDIIGNKVLPTPSPSQEGI